VRTIPWILVLTIALVACGGDGDEPAGGPADEDGGAPAAGPALTGDAAIAEAWLRANATVLDVVGDPPAVTIKPRPSREAMIELYRRTGIPEESLEAEVDRMLAKPWIAYTITGPRVEGKHAGGNVTVVDGAVTAASLEVIDAAAQTGETWDLVTGERD
jgi:hypothetical protein